MKNLAIFASGNGSNAENIMRYFKDHKEIKVSVIICNRETAGVIGKAKAFGVPVSIVSERSFFQSEDFVKNLSELDIDLIVLAGFLWKIPDLLLEAFEDRIINIHPALLPKHGGKGMYGNHVHKAVLDANDEESGITIHKVNSNYDEGEILFQKKIPVEKGMTPESLAEKILKLEHEWYPRVIEKTLENL